MKKTVSLILSIIMIITAMPVAVLGADEVCKHEVDSWGYYFAGGSGDGKTFDCTDSAYTIKRNGQCTKCNTTIDEVIPTQPFHHTKQLPMYDEDGNIIVENYKEPTCTENGYTRSQCVICNTIVTEIIFAEGHDYGERVVYSPCFAEGSSEEGIYRRYCTKSGCEDGYIDERITDHNLIVYEETEASCFGPGRTGYKICLTCSTESKTTEIPKLNHIDSDGNGKCDLCFSSFLGEGVFCDCICHSNNTFIQMIMPLIKLIWQILGVDNCHGDCNAVHYVKK